MFNIGDIVEIKVSTLAQGYEKGDIGVITKDKKILINHQYCYYVHIYGKENPNEDNGDFKIFEKNITNYRYKKGDRIKIITKKSKYCGYYGTVAKDQYSYFSDVNVYIDGTDYQLSSNGNRYLTYSTTSITFLGNNEKGENYMKLTGFTHVAKIEKNGEGYYYALYDEDVRVGDNIIVTGCLAGNIYVVKEVLTLDEMRKFFDGTITEEVKCKVDLSSYNQRVANREKAAKLRKQMDEEIKKMDEINKYEMYADRNPALKEMLEQLKNLGV